MAKTTAHQRLIFEVQNPVGALIETENYPVLFKYLNYVS
jgi:hypothetical protein